MVDDVAIEAWFCQEVLREERALTSFIRRNWRADGDVQDLCHDVYALAIAGARRGLPANTKAYLFTVARNHLINQAKRARIVPIDLVADLEAVDGRTDMLSADRHVSAREELRRFQEGLNRLSPRMREVVVLRKVEGFDTRETATRMNIGTETVKTQLALGMKALADFMLGGPGKAIRSARAEDRPGSHIKGRHTK